MPCACGAHETERQSTTRTTRTLLAKCSIITTPTTTTTTPHHRHCSTHNHRQPASEPAAIIMRRRPQDRNVGQARAVRACVLRCFSKKCAATNGFFVVVDGGRAEQRWDGIPKSAYRTAYTRTHRLFCVHCMASRLTLIKFAVNAHTRMPHTRRVALGRRHSGSHIVKHCAPRRTPEIVGSGEVSVLLRVCVCAVVRSFGKNSTLPNFEDCRCAIIEL